MNVIRKDATITNTDEEFPGSFEVVLSTATKDRDGDELAMEDWKQPLPEHITFDVDHGMSVEKTVGSGVPSIEEDRLVVRGTYSSLPRAQEVRTLVKEGHIRTTSVAFMSEKVTKDGKTKSVRELLNGAFVAIPSNTDAKVLSAKAGARNSASDQANIQAAHDAITKAGADCGPSDDTGAEEGAMGGKTVSTAATKAAGVESNPTLLAQAVDAAIDEALVLLADVDLSTLPEPVAQAIGLVTAAGMSVDQLLDAMGVEDPDDEEETAADGTTPEQGDVAKSVDADVLDLQHRALTIQVNAFTA